MHGPLLGGQLGAKGAQATAMPPRGQGRAPSHPVAAAGTQPAALREAAQAGGSGCTQAALACGSLFPFALGCLAPCRKPRMRFKELEINTSEHVAEVQYVGGRLRGRNYHLERFISKQLWCSPVLPASVRTNA